MSEEFISIERKKELEEELETLKTTKRQEILAALKFAKDLGDLSENAEYHQAREAATAKIRTKPKPPAEAQTGHPRRLTPLLWALLPLPSPP